MQRVVPDIRVLRYGHPGADWGSLSSPVCGYNPAYKFGVCVVYNSAIGMNCTMTFDFDIIFTERKLATRVTGCPQTACYK